MNKANIQSRLRGSQGSWICAEGLSCILLQQADPMEEAMFYTPLQLSEPCSLSALFGRTVLP